MSYANVYYLDGTVYTEGARSAVDCAETLNMARAVARAQKNRS